MKTDTPWNDLFVRTDVSETIPESRVGGFGSPDIIPIGTDLKPPSDFATADSYARYYQQPFYQGKPNYIYVRAKNSSTGENATGRVRLGMSNPAVVLWPGPGKWTILKTTTGNDYADLNNIGGGAIGVIDDPFDLIPTESGHRCLVTWISTKKHPISSEPPEITTAAALADFLIKHPNYAHHNIDITADTTGIQSRISPFTSGDQAGDWVFSLTVENCKGFTVSFSCAKQLKSGQYIQLLDQLVGDDTRYSFNIDRPVESGFAADIVYTYNQNNVTKKDFSVFFKASYRVPVGHPLWNYAQPYHTFDPVTGFTLSDARKIEVGSIGVMRGDV